MGKKLICILLTFSIIFCGMGATYADEITTAKTPTQTVQQDKHLVVDKEHKMIFGVCAGIANYFGVDVNIVRIGFVLFSLFGGSGVLVYLIMALIMS